MSFHRETFTIGGFFCKKRQKLCRILSREIRAKKTQLNSGLLLFRSLPPQAVTQSLYIQTYNHQVGKPKYSQPELLPAPLRIIIFVQQYPINIGPGYYSSLNSSLSPFLPDPQTIRYLVLRPLAYRTKFPPPWVYGWENRKQNNNTQKSRRRRCCCWSHLLGIWPSVVIVGYLNVVSVFLVVSISVNCPCQTLPPHSQGFVVHNFLSSSLFSFEEDWERTDEFLFCQPISIYNFQSHHRHRRVGWL